jgi:heat shock protein HtpX
MPLTFIDIEKQKNWRIWIFFLVLMLLYFCVTVLFASAFFHTPFSAAPRFWVFLAVTAMLIAGIHFWSSAYDTVATVTRELNALPPDRQDEIHRVLLNIMEEMHVVTGNRRRIQCFIIPSLSLNALAVSDLKGEAAIAITEGLLSRLTRPQLETVVAHEAHHILAGDCLETTVAASIFGTYASALEKMQYTSRGRSFASPPILLAWVLLQLSYLLNLFISREREYRADAASVRMTRDPVALAEVLHLLSRSWRGAGFIGNGFEMLCIVNPQAMALDEAEGFWADLLSTHPPIRKRMQLLLNMARVSITELDAKARKRTTPQVEGPGFYAMNPQRQWQGPFSLADLGTLPWLSPLTWVTAGEERPVGRAWREPAINAIFTLRTRNGENRLSDHVCPACGQSLTVSSYEGTRIFQCNFCAGTLVENDKIARIIARTGRERACSERINALARAVTGRNHGRRAGVGAADNKSVPLLSCPKCRNAMRRGFYSSAHLIEVDRCSYCGLTWFDQEELAMLQCMIENRIMPDVETSATPDPLLA